MTKKFSEIKLFLSKNLCEDNDSAMSDCRFKIEKEVELLNARRNIPLFFSNQSW